MSKKIRPAKAAILKAKATGENRGAVVSYWSLESQCEKAFLSPIHIANEFMFRLARRAETKAKRLWKSQQLTGDSTEPKTKFQACMDEARDQLRMDRIERAYRFERTSHDDRSLFSPLQNREHTGQRKARQADKPDTRNVRIRKATITAKGRPTWKRIERSPTLSPSPLSPSPLTGRLEHARLSAFAIKGEVVMYSEGEMKAARLRAMRLRRSLTTGDQLSFASPIIALARRAYCPIGEGDKGIYFYATFAHDSEGR